MLGVMAYTPRVFRKGTRAETANSLGEETALRWDGWAPDDGVPYTPPPAFSATELSALKAVLVPFWAPSEAVTTGLVRVDPTGHLITANSNRTTRATYDATEQAAWTVVSGGGGGGGAVASVNGQTGAVVLEADDIADAGGKVVMTSAERTKLGGVAANATANDTDANLRARANHTGTQAISTVSGLQTALDGKAAAIEVVNTVAASGGAVTLPDVGAATIHDVTLTANCTFTFPTVAAGKSFLVRLTQDATGSRTATWPATVKWPGGLAPTLSTAAGKQDVISFVSVGGANWSGFVAGLDVR